MTMACRYRARPDSNLLFEKHGSRGSGCEDLLRVSSAENDLSVVQSLDPFWCRTRSASEEKLASPRSINNLFIIKQGLIMGTRDTQSDSIALLYSK